MPRSNYDDDRTEAGKARLAISEKGRDIGKPPPVKNPKRRKSCSGDFRRFCETYFPDIYCLPWSSDHLIVISQIEETVLHGGLFATAMPRGGGKTSLCEQAAEWAILYGHRGFVVPIGSDAGRSEGILDSIKVDLESNELLFEDFPEACYPIRKLEGIAHRCKGQLSLGKRTCIGWSACEITMPTIPRSKASGAVIKTTGITGGIRGMKIKRQDGVTVRPDLVIVDDPQTDESARSASQCETRERILAGAILGLAGPGKKISGIMPCTVISRGDMADRILDRSKHPEWNGTRTKMVYAFPSNTKLWEEYARIRKLSLEKGNAGKEATEFYATHKAEMDLGAKVAWEARFNHDELSALQHAMNIMIDRPRAFHAEFQNEPLPEVQLVPDDLTTDQIATKLTRIERGHVALAYSRLTAFIDVHGSLLYYVVTAWEDDFTGQIIDYGAYPDQKLDYFALRDAKRTMATEKPEAGLEGQIYAGLTKLCGSLLGREWTRDDGVGMKIERCLIDANWGTSTELIYKFCRESEFSTVLTPSHGKYVGAASTPMREWAKKSGERTGPNWRLRSMKEKRSIRSALFDTNWWKSFIHARLSVAMGDRGCLSLFGINPEQHRLFADHLTAEYRVVTEGRGRKCDEWKSRPERPDNHWLDCLVGSAVAASIQGVTLAESIKEKPIETAKRISFAELQRRKNSSPEARP